ALPRPTATPTPGQKNVEINQSGVKITRPGFSTLTATGRQFIVDSERVPAKIIKTGQLTINAGANVLVPTRIPLTATTYVDYLMTVGNGSSWQHPAGATGFGRNDGAELGYAITAGGVRF